MKKLNPFPPPVFIIPSNRPRTRQGPDSRGIRICIAQIGRSCVLDTGYVTFTDGSAYVYTPPSKTEFEDLCASLQRGRQFNLDVRRSTGGYVKGFVPPPDFEIIYSYPPYPGTVPAACPLPLHPWPDLEWATEIIFLDDGQSFVFVPASGFSDTMEFQFASGSTNAGGDCKATGSAIYNGSGTSAFLDLSETGGTSGTPGNIHVLVTQDGVTVFEDNYDTSAPFSDNPSFAFADTSGLDSTIVVLMEWTSGGTFPFTAWDFVAIAS